MKYFVRFALFLGLMVSVAFGAGQHFIIADAHATDLRFAKVIESGQFKAHIIGSYGSKDGFVDSYAKALAKMPKEAQIDIVLKGAKVKQTDLYYALQFAKSVQIDNPHYYFYKDIKRDLIKALNL